MHEMSLCESILQVIEDEARLQSFHKVVEVHLAIGTLAGVEVDALKFSFDVVVQHSLAQDAELCIQMVPATGLCPSCGQQCAVENRYDPCLNCGSFGLQITNGDQMRITHLEVQ